MLGRIPIAFPVGVTGPRRDLLIVEARSQRERRVRLPSRGNLGGVGVLRVYILVQDLTGRRGDLIDITSVTPVPGARPNRKLIVYGSTRGDTGFIVGGTAVRGGTFGASVDVRRLEVRLRRDETDSASFSAGPEQSPLRPAQHLHSLEIEHARIRVAAEVSDVANLNWGIVDIDRRRGRTDIGGHAANGNVGAIIPCRTDCIREVQSGSESGEVINLPHALLIHFLLGVGGDGDWNLA